LSFLPNRIGAWLILWHISCSFFLSEGERLIPSLLLKIPPSSYRSHTEISGVGANTLGKETKCRKKIDANIKEQK
jgi:hypothetical protein